MKVENGNIILDDEIIDLTKVMNIGLTGWGSPFETPKHCISFEYADGGNTTVDATVSTSKLKLFTMLNKIFKEMVKTGNDNFVNLGFVLVNMDFVDSVVYNKDNRSIVITSNECRHEYAVPAVQAKLIIDKYNKAYQQYVDLASV